MYYYRLQADFVDRFSAKDNILLWSVVPISSFTGSTAQELAETLVSYCTEYIRDWLHKSSPTAKDVQSLVKYMTLSSVLGRLAVR